MARSRLLRSLENDDADQLGIARRTGSVVETAEDLHNAVQRARRWYQNKIRWTVTVASSDRLYDAVLRWFLSEESDSRPPRSVKATLSTSRRARLEFLDDEYGPVGGSRNAPPRDPITIFYDERGSRTINVGGHKVLVHLQRPEPAGGFGGAESYRPVQPDQLYFYANSKDGQDAVVDLLRVIASDQDKRKPALHLMDNWGDWTRRDDLPERSVDSVVLKSGQMERLVDDLQGFLDDEHDYVRRGMPYHRGYLLHGPPGTGKTSIVRALAAHFSLDLWYAPLGDLQKDTSLLTLINRVKPNSILLLEDIDIFHSSRNRKDDSSGLSMAGLLNALDGVATPHGMITFMTTNDLKVIDEAVIRPGRVDVREEISMPDKHQIGRLFDSWYETKLTRSQVMGIKFKGSTADVTEIFKRNLNDQAAALQVLRQQTSGAEERSVSVTALKEKRDEREGKRGSTRREGSS